MFGKKNKDKKIDEKDDLIDVVEDEEEDNKEYYYDADKDDNYYDEEDELDEDIEYPKKKDNPKSEKKKNDSIIKINPIHSYKFWFKIFGAVLLVILGFILLFQKQAATSIVLMFTGGVFSLYAIIRVVPLMKTLEKGSSKVLCFVEILIDLIIGVLLIFLSIKNFGDEQTGIVKFASENYNILIGFVLWLRGFVYFVSTILFAEKTDNIQLFVHIAVITFGSFLFGVKIDASKIALALAILAFVCGVVIAGSGFFDYGKYRSNVKDVREKKDDKKKTSKKKEAPARKGKKEIDDPEDRTPLIDHNDDDRPYVS